MHGLATTGGLIQLVPARRTGDNNVVFIATERKVRYSIRYFLAWARRHRLAGPVTVPLRQARTPEQELPEVRSESWSGLSGQPSLATARAAAARLVSAATSRTCRASSGMTRCQDAASLLSPASSAPGTLSSRSDCHFRLDCLDGGGGL